MSRLYLVFLCLMAFTPKIRAQTDESPGAGGLTPPSVSERWRHFGNETFTPLTVGAEAFNAAVSQASNSTPMYGSALWPAFPERYGAAWGDVISQNFFGDFLLASAFHEDTRYIRRGPKHKFWPRVFYAISRSVVTRSDSGSSTFNASNVAGTAMSAALSNAYYPPASRGARAATINWTTGIAESGFANLLPEFWPDVHGWLKRHLPGGR